MILLMNQIYLVIIIRYLFFIILFFLFIKVSFSNNQFNKENLYILKTKISFIHSVIHNKEISQNNIYFEVNK